jgi:hypothetical protein
MKKSTLVFILMIFFESYLTAQQSYGIIMGSLNKSNPDSYKNIFINLLEESSHFVIQRINLNSSGEFTFRDVPFGTYKLNAFENNNQYCSSTENCT